MLDFSAFDALGPAIFYPRPDPTRAPAGAHDLSLPVAPGVALGARFHPLAPDAPNLVLFHGNGEVVGDYDDVAADYGRAGVGLAVVDFRGYGRSGGQPSFSAMIDDARLVFPRLGVELVARGYRAPAFAMGRSLGTFCALELAASFPNELRGLIVESGSGELARLARFAGIDPGDRRVAELIRAHDERLRAIEMPLLVIHGEQDEMIPLADARALLARLGSKAKRLEVIPSAGHNDLWWLGRARYFAALGEFIRAAGVPASSASR